LFHGLYGPNKNDSSAWNEYDAIPAVKSPFLKHCKVFEHSLRFVVPKPSLDSSPTARDLTRTSIQVLGFKTDFIIWNPETWSLLDFSKITFSQDPHINISVRSYMEKTMILWFEEKWPSHIASARHTTVSSCRATKCRKGKGRPSCVQPASRERSNRDNLKSKSRYDLKLAKKICPLSFFFYFSHHFKYNILFAL
jgi:hypothetical protein